MDSLPQELLASIPPLGSTQFEPNPIVWMKFYSSMFQWRWFIVEYEDVEGTPTFCGWLSSSLEPLGQFITSDLASMRARFGITIGHDTSYTPCRLSEALCVEAGLQKFLLGQVVATPGALELLERARRQPLEFILRHVTGDFGDLDEHDRLVNEQALLHGGRILSSYRIIGEERLWILTEWDRSASTLLLPSEY